LEGFGIGHFRDGLIPDVNREKGDLAGGSGSRVEELKQQPLGEKIDITARTQFRRKTCPRKG